MGLEMLHKCIWKQQQVNYNILILGSGPNLNSLIEQKTELDIDMSTASISTSNTLASEKYHADSSANKDTTK